MRRPFSDCTLARRCLAALILSSLASGAQAALFGLSTTSAAAKTTSTQRPAEELIFNQDPPKIAPRVLEKMTPESATILISLSKQRAYLMSNGEIAVDTPISSGKRARMTPKGHFKVLEKEPDHHANIYGTFSDAQNRVVRAGVSSRIDSAPSGTHFVGLPMLFFLRLTDDGMGLHAGLLPGYAEAHGCVRLPAEIAPIFFAHAKVGTPTEIAE